MGWFSPRHPSRFKERKKRESKRKLKILNRGEWLRWVRCSAAQRSLFFSPGQCDRWNFSCRILEICPQLFTETTEPCDPQSNQPAGIRIAYESVPLSCGARLAIHEDGVTHPSTLHRQACAVQRDVRNGWFFYSCWRRSLPEKKTSSWMTCFR